MYRDKHPGCYNEAVSYAWGQRAIFSTALEIGPSGYCWLDVVRDENLFNGANALRHLGRRLEKRQVSEIDAQVNG